VLEIGAGSGYLAALLAAHADHVWSLEIDPDLADMARRNLHRQGVDNVTVETANGAAGLPVHAPYDVIVVSGALPELPQELKDQLKVGGRLFAIVGEAPMMTALLVTRVAADSFRSVVLFETLAAPLSQVAAPGKFVF
jgi:protein-L-isoaspartate(D-aspartate) O-methyltransferase